MSTIIRETVEDNESIYDLLQLEQFKQWAKENMIGVSALAISVAGIITIIVGTRNPIEKTGKSAGTLAKARTTNSTIIEFIGSRTLL